jgi:hypothetical protein
MTIEELEAEFDQIMEPIEPDVSTPEGRKAALEAAFLVTAICRIRGKSQEPEIAKWLQIIDENLHVLTE